MLGYSDSAKDGGLMASRWALQLTQVELAALARASGVRIVFFHGRGGSVSRGGGKTSRAVMAAPRGSVDGILRRSAARRVGKEGVSPCRSRWAPYNENKNRKEQTQDPQQTI